MTPTTEMPVREPGELPPAHPNPNACDFCHFVIASDAVYSRLTVGVNDDGPSESGSVVEQTSELIACHDCRPGVNALVDRFLERLWALVRDPVSPAEPAPAEGDLEPSLPSVLSTPYGFATAEMIAAGAELMAVAARAHPPSPEGFALGIVIGRMLGAGLSGEEVHGIVDEVIGTAPMGRATGASA